MLFAVFLSHAKVFVLAVGVNDYYGNKNDLKVAVIDAKSIAQFFKGNNYEIKLLTDGQAKKTNILSQMKMLFKQAKSEDKVLFYFSGHGGNGYLLPYDYTEQVNALFYSEIQAVFKESKAQFKMCVIDACYSGSIIQPKISSLNTSLTKEHINLFLSSRANQISIEMRDKGLFTSSFLKGLTCLSDKNGDGKVTMFELYLYVRTNLMKASLGKQIPVMIGNFNRDDVVINCKR